MAAHPTPSIKVLALGMPRTGTMSVKLALEHLGYGPAHHGLDVVHRSHEATMWNELLHKKYYQRERLSRKDLDRLFGGYVAVTDMCFLIWEDLLDAYPDAKLILINREVYSWYTSFCRTLLCNQFDFKALMFKYLIEPILGTDYVRMGEMMQLSFFEATSRQEFHANAKRKYTQYYMAVSAAAKARERPILECEMGSGWKPLCEFLGCKVPNIGFPRANEEEKMLALWSQVQRDLLARFLKLMGWYTFPLLALLIFGWMYLNAGRSHGGPLL